MSGFDRPPRRTINVAASPAVGVLHASEPVRRGPLVLVMGGDLQAEDGRQGDQNNPFSHGDQRKSILTEPSFKVKLRSATARPIERDHWSCENSPGGEGRPKPDIVGV